MTVDKVPAANCAYWPAINLPKRLLEQQHWPTQALEEERLGPRRPSYSDERQKRLAVQEAATALICTLMPAIEPVTIVRDPPSSPSMSSLHPVTRQN